MSRSTRFRKQYNDTLNEYRTLSKKYGSTEAVMLLIRALADTRVRLEVLVEQAAEAVKEQKNDDDNGE